MNALFAILFSAVQVIHTSGTRDAVPGTVARDARPGITIDFYRALFDAGSFFLKYSRRGDRIVKEKWGDYFFALHHGYAPRNGGWDRWNFLGVLVKDGKGTFNALSKSMPSVFIGYGVGGADYVAAEWEVPGGRDRLKLRFAKFPSHRGWLFLEVDFGSIRVEQLHLSCYPGNAAVTEGRERHLATREKDWNLDVESAKFSGGSPCLLMYSRYFDDQFGNKLVFEPEKCERVEAWKTKASVSPRFFPKAGTKSLRFALGFFSNRDPDDQLTRFLGEDGDAIRDFLASVDFTAMPDEADFLESVSIARALGVEKETLDPVCRRFREAVAARNIAEVSDCVDAVRQFRAAATAAGLGRFSRETEIPNPD